MFPAQLQPPGLRKSSYSRAELLQCGRGQLFGPGNAGHIVAELDITSDLWFFDCHFPDFKTP